MLLKIERELKKVTYQMENEGPNLFLTILPQRHYFVSS